MNQQNYKKIQGQRTQKWYCWSSFDIINRGQEGVIYKGFEESQPTQFLAIKHLKRVPPEEKSIIENLLLKENKNLIQYYDYYYPTINSQDQNIYYIMELAGKNLLEQWTNSSRDMQNEDQYKLFRDIANGIQEMHINQFTHRDLKPENIVNTKSGWKICDFGLSKNQNQLQTFFIGTPYYIAPELIQFASGDQKPYTKSVDIWSFGCLIYEAITKEIFFNGANADQIAQSITNYAQNQWQNFTSEKIQDERFNKISNIKLQNLIKSMLIVSPQYRIEIQKVIEELDTIFQKPRQHFQTTINPVFNFSGKPGTQQFPPQKISTQQNQDTTNQFKFTPPFVANNFNNQYKQQNINLINQIQQPNNISMPSTAFLNQLPNTFTPQKPQTQQQNQFNFTQPPYQQPQTTTFNTNINTQINFNKQTINNQQDNDFQLIINKLFTDQGKEDLINFLNIKTVEDLKKQIPKFATLIRDNVKLGKENNQH